MLLLNECTCLQLASRRELALTWFPDTQVTDDNSLPSKYKLEVSM